MVDDPNRIDLPGGYFIEARKNEDPARWLCGPPLTAGDPAVAIGTIVSIAAASFAAAMNAATARADAAEARVKELEAVLKPFADYAGRLGPGAPAWADATGRYDFSITVADFRRARGALAETQPAPAPSTPSPAITNGLAQARGTGR